jgi:hypothetical protein
LALGRCVKCARVLDWIKRRKWPLGWTAVGLLLALVAANWFTVKAFVADLMVSIGVDWKGMSDGDKLNAAVGVLTGLIGIILAYIGVVISRKQQRIAELAQAAANFERTKRAMLTLSVPGMANSIALRDNIYTVFITNEGDRAEGGYFYLGIPKSVVGKVRVDEQLGVSRIEFPVEFGDIVDEYDAPQHSHFRDDYALVKFQVNSPVVPGGKVPCVKVIIAWPQDAIRDPWKRTFLWFTNGPSGRVPKQGMNKLKLYSPYESIWKPQYGGPVEFPPDGD